MIIKYFIILIFTWYYLCIKINKKLLSSKLLSSEGKYIVLFYNNITFENINQELHAHQLYNNSELIQILYDDENNKDDGHFNPLKICLIYIQLFIKQ